MPATSPIRSSLFAASKGRFLSLFTPPSLPFPPSTPNHSHFIMRLSCVTVPAFIAAITSVGAGPNRLPRAESTGPGSIKLLGRRTAGQQELYKRADGSFNLTFLQEELAGLRVKYGANVNNAHARGVPTTRRREKRANGAVPLNDYATDVEYYGDVCEF